MQIKAMAHVLAARAVLLGMITRGKGYLLNMVSAAGLLNQIDAAAHSTTKHAAIGFAEKNEPTIFGINCTADFIGLDLA
jgi:short-subunit dehydrogenase